MVEELNFTVYRSSAGSGKTYSLVQGYIALALQNNNPYNFSEILAVTFTNKAANEMKSRVLNYLEAFANGNYEQSGLSQMQVQLKNRLKIGDEELQQRASSTLSAILHQYSSFSITTIDKFVYNIIRSFSFDLKVPFSAEVETDSDTILNNAIGEVLVKVGIEEYVTDMLVEYAISKLDEEKSWNIEQNLFDFAKQLLQEEGQKNIDKLSNLEPEDFNRVKRRATDYVNSFKKSIQAIGDKACSEIRHNNISVTDFYYGAKGIGRYFQKLSEFDSENLQPNSYVIKTIEEDKWYGGKITEETKANIETARPKLHSYYQHAQQELTKLPQYFFCEGLLQTFVGIALLNEIEKLIHAYYQEQNVIHISEFNKRISEIVKNEPAPFIYERIGEKYRHFLIDEFQDTSILQWNNLLPLIDESLSKGKFNMLVGDGKQAIYRWRDGEVKQFSSLPNLYPTPTSTTDKMREQVLQANYHEEVLEKNYRSKKEVVEFNNLFFSVAASQLDEQLQEIYSRGEQQVVKGEGGYVSVQQYNPDEEKNDFALETTVKNIQQAINDGYSLQDITILVRKNEEATKTAAYLSEQDINVVSAESLLLSGSGKVQLIITILKYLLNPNDSLIRVQAVSLYNLYHALQNKWHGNISNAARGVLPEVMNDLNAGKPLYELVEEIIHRIFPNSTSDSFLLALLEFVYQFNKKHSRSLFELLQEWEQKKKSLSINMPEEINAVRIATIHKSKGLEYPVVIIPFADWKKRKAKEYLWLKTEIAEFPELPVALFPNNKKLEQTEFVANYREEKNKNELDHLNLLYVAFTRASERLHIISANNRYKEMGSFINKVMEQAFAEWDGVFFQKGTLQKASYRQNRLAEQAMLDKAIHSDWRDKVAIAYTAKGNWSNSEENESLTYGKLVHELMADINDPSQLNSAIKKVQKRYNISKQEVAEIDKKAKNLLNKEELKIAFNIDSKIYNENEILLPDGITFRPDRVVCSKNKTLVLDYKTGVKREEYKNQVQNYCKILSEMGYTNVQGLLAYFDTGEIEAV